MNRNSKHRSKITNGWYDGISVKKPHIFISKVRKRWFVAGNVGEVGNLGPAINFAFQLNRARAKS